MNLILNPGYGRSDREDATQVADIRIIEDPSRFEALQAPWERLDIQPGVRPFQEFGWSAAWMRTLGKAGNYRLRIGTLWLEGKLAAVLPFCVRRYRGVRTLEWIGARVTDYCDALVDSQLDADSVLPLLWQALIRRGGFDVARFSHVRTDAKSFGVLNKLNPWVETLEEASGVPIAWSTGAQWLAQQGKGMRERVMYKSRRAQKAGFQLHVPEPLQPYGPIIDTLIAQKRLWLGNRGLRSFIDQPEGGYFLRAAVEHFAARGELQLSTVRSKDNQIAAVDLTFIREGVLYSHIASFDPQFAKFGLGRLLTDHLLMWACDNGLKRLDLLLGSYDYKTEYGCTPEPVRTLVVPRGLLGHAAVSLYRHSVLRARRGIT